MVNLLILNFVFFVFYDPKKKYIEPTSGLDSTVSEYTCKVLRTIAEHDLTIVAVIHQVIFLFVCSLEEHKLNLFKNQKPRYEIFKMFHQVMLLAEGGKIVYHGPSTEALPYFESLGFVCPPHTNPADFMMGKTFSFLTFSPCPFF